MAEFLKGGAIGDAPIICFSQANHASGSYDASRLLHELRPDCSRQYSGNCTSIYQIEGRIGEVKRQANVHHMEVYVFQALSFCLLSCIGDHAFADVEPHDLGSRRLKSVLKSPLTGAASGVQDEFEARKIGILWQETAGDLGQQCA